MIGPTPNAALYKHLVRPLLFCLDPERAHRLAQATLASEIPWALLGLGEPDPRLKTKVGRLALSSPIGLGAGFDKNGRAVPGLQHLGFGFVCVGSIVPKPSAGNARPRLLRYPETESLVNCYGMPSEGLDACAARFRRLAAKPRRTVLVANFSCEADEDYARAYAACAPYVDGIELGLQCPNRTEHQSIYPVDALARLLNSLKDRWPDTPTFVKLPPYFNDVERANRFELVALCADLGLAGVIVPGNWSVKEPRLSRGQGSVAGRMTFDRNLTVMHEVAAVARGRIAIKAAGGVSTGEEALQVLAAGATLIDILAVFVYRGWAAAALINRELAALMQQQRVTDVRALQPSWA
jgi:dihydroorotate dehydrogenase (fumarate)/dihydroorotate dehydrogenase